MLTPYLRAVLEKLDLRKLKTEERTYVEICELALNLTKLDSNFNVLAALSQIDKNTVEIDANAILSEIQLAEQKPEEILAKLRALREKVENDKK